MKPLRITLRNVGPFLDQTVDFTQLSDIFLVTGKTGSGKTTIFSAMTYALYGRLAGGESKGLHFHSDFAQSSDDGLVDFTFLLAGRTYRVRRTVPGQHLTRTNRKKQVDVEVTLEQLDSATGQWIASDGKASELTQKIESLVGLSAEEFTQIVLLPQGKFAEFLGKKPKERQETLAKLFPVDVYKRLCEQSLAQAKTMTLRIQEKQSALDAESRGFDAKEATERIGQLAAEERRLSAEQERAVTAIAGLTRQKTELEGALTAARRRQSLEQELQALKEREPRVQQDKERAHLSRKAAHAMEKIRAAQKEAGRLTQIARDHEDALRELQELQRQAATLDERAAEHEQNRARLERLSIDIAQTSKQLEHAASLAAVRTQLGQQTETLRALYQKTVPALKKAERLLSQNQAQAEEARRLLEQEKERQDALREQELAQKTQDMASHLAAGLADGMPCPVCGATHHPAPAAKPAATQDVAQKLRQCRDTIRELETRATRLQGEQVQLAEARLTMSHFAEHIEAAAQTLGMALPARDTFAEREKPLPTGNSYATQQKAITDAVTAASDAAARLEQAGQAADGAEALQARLDALTRQKQELTGAVQAYQTERDRHTKALSSCTAQADLLGRQRKDAQAQAADAQHEAELAVAQSGLGSTDDVQSHFMPQEELDALEEAIAGFERDFAAARARLEETPEQDATSDALDANLEHVSQQLAAQTQALSQVQKELSVLSAQRAAMEQKASTVRRIAQELCDLQAQSAPLLRLADDVNGKNPKKITLESWVLGSYFEEVVRAANVHFSRFSSGRYAFVLETEKQGGNGGRGLDLSISDSFTGQSRSSDSLSGGEKFMASLCLALALTDVVQQKSGGIRLDSLFIDEGFGALDAQLLDTAVRILEDVREERMVGIISHVEALSSQIPCHIEVNKTAHGSTITLTGTVA